MKAGMLAVKDNNNILSDEKIINIINDFNSSKRRSLMLTGERYYECENDIFKRRITKVVDGATIEETYKANNKLAHSKYKNQVDEKINYLLSKEHTLKCDDKQYLTKINDILDELQYDIVGLGYEASNKGIGWMQPYIDADGNFKTMVIPSEQCIPVWRDNSHKELDAMIRVYETITWEGSRKKTLTNVEVWTESEVKYYRQEGRTLIPDYNLNNDNNGPVAHYKKGDAWLGWGKVPFIPFKNNRIEMPDIKFVKTLVDAYDLSRSEAANYVEEVKNLIFVLKGYGGEDIGEFMDRLNKYRAIPIDDPTDGGVDTLTPTMDITALREHYEQLKRDLIEDGQSVNKDLDKFGSAPSGIALGFMYSGLDLKCNAFEVEFKRGFKELLYFLNRYLSENNLGNYDKVKVELIFNRDMKIDETEVIENCSKSKGIISDETIIGNHPWVKDIEVEKNKIKEEEEEKLPQWDSVPIKKVDENGQGKEE